MDMVAFRSLQLSPAAWVVLLAGGIFIGALLLVGVVRLTEGFSISLWTAAKITCAATVTMIVLQVVVTLALMPLKFSPTAFIWISLSITLLGSLAVYTWLYGTWVKSPAGKSIGMARAIKVTLVQTGLQLVVIIAIAVLLAVLILRGVIDMPTLPS